MSQDTHSGMACRSEEIHSFVKCLRDRGSAAERESLLKAQTKTCDLFVTSYSLLQRDAKRYRSYEFYYVILDEAQYAKNAKSLTAMAVKRFGHNIVSH